MLGDGLAVYLEPLNYALEALLLGNVLGVQLLVVGQRHQRPLQERRCQRLCNAIPAAQLSLVSPMYFTGSATGQSL